MALQAGTNHNPIDRALASIRRQIIDAVSLMFNRAIASSGPDAPKINDDKEGLNESGNLQDCEFGMILLLVREWFRDQLIEEEFLEAINSSDFEKVIIALMKSVTSRVLVRKQSDEGGEGNAVSFFTGDPYTKYDKGRTSKYSANLDAAMITLAFLAPAIERFNQQLAVLDHDLRLQALPDWVRNQRDASFLVILEGLKYARDCRVDNNTGFQGFTSDPVSQRARPADGAIELEFDRLFFTWTACETINDLKRWRGSYLKALASIPTLEQPVAEANSLIEELEGMLREAAEWCKDHFLPVFKDFKAENAKDLVRKVKPLGDERIPSDLEEQIERTAASVQYVYHFSQYAAIRSLVPELVLIEEAQIILEKVDELVTTTILGSELDKSTQPDLFRTLTRLYSLGTSPAKKYIDDAWYPLVVRSLSGLLYRILNDLNKRFLWDDVNRLTLLFSKSLDNHFNNMIDRRPFGGEEGPDGKLWSYAVDGPYVLYATQRTIFASMKYADFLIEVDRFQKEKPQEGDLPTRVARDLGEKYFREVIIDILAKAGPHEFLARSSPDTFDSDHAMPKDAWAASVIRKWLVSFTASFEQSQVKTNLAEKASWLSLIKECVERYQPTKGLDARKRKGVEEQLAKLKEEYEKIRNFEQVGKRLAGLKEWEGEELNAILFEYLFQNCVQRAAISIDELTNTSTKLWKLIKDALDTRDSIKNLDPTGIP